MKINDADMTYEMFLLLRKDMDRFLNKFFVNGVEKSNFFPDEIYHSTSILVIKIAVNNEVKIPINRVVANPLIGPVPKINKTRAVTPVVAFASKMDDNALLKPSAIACFNPFFSIYFLTYPFKN